jgi:hypothetical protein
MRGITYPFGSVKKHFIFFESVVFEFNIESAVKYHDWCYSALLQAIEKLLEK